MFINPIQKINGLNEINKIGNSTVSIFEFLGGNFLSIKYKDNVGTV